jgi:hypothetical protein
MDNSNENSDMETIDVRSYILSPELRKYHHLYEVYGELLNKNAEHLNALTEKSIPAYCMITTGLRDQDNLIGPVTVFDEEIEQNNLVDLLSRTRTTFVYSWILGSERASQGKDLREGDDLWIFDGEGNPSIKNSDLILVRNYTHSHVTKKLQILLKNNDINYVQYGNLINFFLKSIDSGILYMFMLGYAYWAKENK